MGNGKWEMGAVQIHHHHSHSQLIKHPRHTFKMKQWCLSSLSSELLFTLWNVTGAAQSQSLFTMAGAMLPPARMRTPSHTTNAASTKSEPTTKTTAESIQYYQELSCLPPKSCSSDNSSSSKSDSGNKSCCSYTTRNGLSIT